MKKSIVLFLFIFGFAAYIFPQSQMVFNSNNNESYLLKYSASGNVYLNRMIQELAAVSQKPANSVSLNFNYNEILKIYKQAGKLNLTAELKNIKIEGDKFYKNFSVEDYFIPQKLTFDVKYFSGNNLLGQMNNKLVTLGKSGNNVILDTDVNDSAQSENYKLQILNKIFEYTFENETEFNNFISKVDAYYSESPVARAKLNSIDNIRSDKESLKNLPDLNKLYEYRDLSASTLNYAEITEKKDFYTKLPLTVNDPEGLKSKIERIKAKSLELNKNSVEIINTLYEVYYKKGVDMLVANNPAQADIFFNKSIEINPKFVPSHLKLAIIYYNSGRAGKAMNKLFEIKDMPADGLTKTEIINFADAMHKDFIIEAVDLNNRNNFDAALDALNRAERICRSFEQIPCKPAMDREYSRAITGKYNIILNDANFQLSKGYLPEAEKIVNAAIDYRQQNINFIPDGSGIAAVLNDIYFSYIQNGNRMTSTANYDRALSEYAQAERICNSYREISCTPELQNGIYDAHNGIYNSYLTHADNLFKAKDFYKADVAVSEAVSYRNQYGIEKNIREDKLLIAVKQATYDDLIVKGLNSYSSKNYNSALNYFNQAQTVQNKYNIFKNNKLSGYISSSAKNLILDKINQGHSKVDYNDLASARQLFSEARELQSNYSLNNDSETVNAISGLKDRIFKQECLNAQNKYDVLFSDATSKLSAKDYLAADDLFSQAINHANSFSQCMIDTRQVADEKNKIAPAVKFIKDVNSADYAVKQRKYAAALDLHHASETYFSDNNISTFGLYSENTFDWIQKQNSEFILYSAEYYEAKDNFEKSVLLVKLLSSRNFNAKYTKPVQTNLANALALRDFDENPSANSYVNISRYTGNDKYFKVFAKTYEKQWKKLKK